MSSVISEQEFNPDILRTPEHIYKTDPRSTLNLRANLVNGKSVPYSLEDHYNEIQNCCLHNCVPIKIHKHFDTARNLYLYSWIVYRFYPVAERHAYTSLEFALREKFADKIREKSKDHKNKKFFSLKFLLKYAIEQGYIKNEDFSLWKERVEIRAKIRHENEKLAELIKNNQESIFYGDQDFIITEQDKNFDLVGLILEYFPIMRNEYSHGSDSLHGNVLGSIKLVSEIINLLYNDKNLSC